jgi:uncharacterized protein YjbI with pentapeptide repeats
MRQPIHEDQVFEKVPALSPGEYDNCKFSHCTFANADFSGYTFSDCTFKDCDLTNLKLHETALKTVAFKRCKLLGVRFETCRDFLFQVAFKECNLELSTFTDWKLKGAVFKNCNLREVDFTGADLREASFAGCDLTRATFIRSDLRKADLREATNYSFSPEENRLRKAMFSIEGLPGLLEEYGIIVG